MNEELAQILFDVQLEWGKGTVEAIKKAMAKIPPNGLKWQGNLRNSIDFDLDKNGKFIFDMEEYGAFLDQGVSGTNKSYNTPFTFGLNAYKGIAYHIKPWADSKGINNWALGYSIMRKGIKPRKFFISVIEKRVNEDLPKLLEKAYNDYLNKSIDEINNQQST